MLKNLCSEYIEQSRKDYWGYCDYLANEVCSWFIENGRSPNALMISREAGYIVPSFCMVCGINIRTTWDYHVVIEVNGHVHDHWFPEVLPREEYLKKNFGRYNDLVAETYLINEALSERIRDNA